MPSLLIRSVIVLLALTLWSNASLAEDEPKLSPLGFLDKTYMSNQRASINDLAQRHFGTSLSGSKQHDLNVLQRLLDQRLVKGSQKRELQAMGLIMGDLLAKELDMNWVVYEDKQGRSRALQYQDSNNFLFPMTMISRRVEVDNRTPVTVIYDKAVRAIDAVRPPQPYTYQ